jgi:hypothetical protein
MYDGRHSNQGRNCHSLFILIQEAQGKRKDKENMLLNADEDKLQGVQLLQVLAEASSTQEQRIVVNLALIAFHDQKTSVYDKLCDAGAVHLVMKCLKKASAEAIYDVATSLCQLIEQLLRCSVDTAVKFFHQHGAELVSTLVALFYKHCNPSLEASMRVLFRRLASLRISLPMTTRGSFLVCMVQRIVRHHRDDRKGLASIASMLLSGWTRHRESKVFVAQFPGLLDDILDYALSENSQDKVYVACLFCNLAWEVRNKVELVKKKGFLESLELFLRDGDQQTKLAAVNTVRQLATEKGVRVLICKHNKSSIVQALHLSLEHTDAKMSAVQAILRLIEKQTATRLVKRCPDLIPHLSSLSTNVDEHAVATMAAHSLKRLAHYISISHDAHPAWIEALLLVAGSPRPRIRFWVAKALLEQTQSKTNAFYMARTPMIMKSVVKLASDSSSLVKCTATEALLCIASDSSNKNLIVSNSEVMEVIVANAQQVSQYHEPGRAAVQMILALVSHDNLKNRLAKHLGLVASLSMYGTLPHGDIDLRRLSLQGVRTLAPLM